MLYSIRLTNESFVRRRHDHDELSYCTLFYVATWTKMNRSIIAGLLDSYLLRREVTSSSDSDNGDDEQTLHTSRETVEQDMDLWLITLFVLQMFIQEPNIKTP